MMNLKKLGLLTLCITAVVGAMPPAIAQDTPPDIEFNPDMQMDPSEFDFDFGDELSEFEDGSFTPGDEVSPAAAAAMSFVILLAVGFGLLLTAIVAYLLYSALKAVPEQYRELSPIIPWLLFVPLVNIVVLVLAFIKVPKSLNNYLTSQGVTSEGDCGEKLGLWGSILYLLGCTFPIGLVLLVIALVKIQQAKKQALALQSAR